MNFYPKRIVSLQPSATVTLEAVGALNRVAACTRYCADVCPEVRTRQITAVEDSWTAQAQQIVEVRPDLVIAAVPYQLEALAQILKARVRFLCLSPATLADIYSDIALIAAVVGEEQKGQKLIRTMLQTVSETRSQYAASPKMRVHCEEWGKPIIHSQPWVSELVEAAGGLFMGTAGQQTTPEAVRDADPEVILAAWCGAGDRVPLEKIVEQRGWQSTSAACSASVFCVSDELFNTPAHTLLGGLRAIAWALHPNSIPQPPGIRQISRIRA